MIHYIVDLSYMIKKFQSTGFSYRQNIGPFEYEAGYVVQTLTAFKKILDDNKNITIYLCLDGSPLRNRILMPSYKIDKDSNGLTNYYPMAAFLASVRQKFPRINILFLPGEEADVVASSLTYLLRGLVSQLDKQVGLLNAFDIGEDPKMLRLLGDLKYSQANINTIANDDEIILCTSDADWYQLLAIDKTYIDKSLSLTSVDGERNTPKTVKNVAPHQITAYKALYGDISDGLPGVRIKGFPTLDYIRSLKTANQFETELFTAGYEATELGRLLWKSGQWQQVYVNYLMAKLDFVGVPMIIT